jgi:hypothetical protein
MATIRRLRGKWQAQARRKGLPPKAKSFVSKVDAEKWAYSLEAELDRAGVLPDTRLAEQMTVRELLDRYLCEITPHKRSASTETYRIKALMQRDIAHRTLAMLSSADVAAYRDARLLEPTAHVCRAGLGERERRRRTGGEKKGTPMSNLPKTSPQERRLYHIAAWSIAVFLAVGILVPMILLNSLDYDTELSGRELIEFIGAHRVWWFVLQNLTMGSMVLSLFHSSRSGPRFGMAMPPLRGSESSSPSPAKCFSWPIFR